MITVGNVTDNILSITLILYIIHICVHRLIHIPRDIILPVYMYLLYLLDGTVEAWMKSSVFIHLMQLPSNPIIFGFGRLALRCDFSKTKIQPLTSLVTPNFSHSSKMHSEPLIAHILMHVPLLLIKMHYMIAMVPSQPMFLPYVTLICSFSISRVDGKG